MPSFTCSKSKSVVEFSILQSKSSYISVQKRRVFKDVVKNKRDIISYWAPYLLIFQFMINQDIDMCTVLFFSLHKKQLTKKQISADIFYYIVTIRREKKKPSLFPFKIVTITKKNFGWHLLFRIWFLITRWCNEK